MGDSADGVAGAGGLVAAEAMAGDAAGCSRRRSMSLGIIGEYIGRIYMCINRSPQYVVRRVENSRGPE